MKIYIKRIAGFLLFLFYVVMIYGQQIISNPMPFLEQLPSNSIYTIYQDRQGFVWIGTSSHGVMRYDGYTVQGFRNDFKTPIQLADNNITTFAEDDKYLWVGTCKGISLIDKLTYQIIPFPDETIQKSDIRDIMVDKKKQIWIVSLHAIYKCNNDLTIQKVYTQFSRPNKINEDNSGNIWILTWEEGLFRYSEKNDSFISYPQIGNLNNPFRILQDNKNRYWIATWGDGLWRFDPDADESKMFSKQPIVNTARNRIENVFYDIVQDDMYGYLWALSHFELYILKINEQNELEKVNVNNLTDAVNQIDKNKSYSRIIKDRKGDLWLSAFDEGSIINFEENYIRNYVLDDIKSDVGLDANIICINKDKKDIFWFNQARYGLCLYNEKTRKIVYSGEKDNLYALDMKTILPSKINDWVWAAGREANAHRLWKMKQENMNVSVLYEINLYHYHEDPGSIVELAEDLQGNLWIATDKHLFIKTSDSEDVKAIACHITAITDMREDKEGCIWVSTPGGIYRLKIDGQPQVFEEYSAILPFLDNDHIKGLCPDINDNIWIFTSLGRLFLFDRKEKQINDYTTVCQLKGDAILRILSRGENIWIILNKQIVRYNLLNNESSIYSVTDDNILITLFRYGAAFIDTDGSLFAAGHKGFIKIKPTRFVPVRKVEERVLLTDVKVENRSVLFNPVSHEKGNSLHSITLLPDARNIEIFFSSVTYTSSRKTKYAYKLEGVDSKWNYISNGKHSAFYNKLGKGEYTFLVKSTDRHGNWVEQERHLIINKLPAYYETWYAFLTYFFIIVVCVYFCVKISIARIKKRNKIALQEELTQTKLNYFTNISHELLTPLTIISCVADDLEHTKAGSMKQVSIMRTNVSRLKRLLQQILDFRKVESNKMPLNVQKRNITSFISTVIASNFQSLARRKHIRLTTHIEKSMWGYLDFDKIDKILFNLLSNAIKYTPEYKQIDLEAEIIQKEGYRYLIVKVKDEGIGIDERDIKQIFTKFYSNRNRPNFESNGIGLSLTKELITLHHGTIEVESELNKGTVFTVEIPVDKEIYDEEEICETCPSTINQEEIAKEQDQNDKPCILFIDDNEDLRELMWDILQPCYHIITAENGREGLDILKNNPVDIIVCDVMMPQMDGLEFCKLAKEDLQTSHIPILMLTAKNAIEDQVDCYKAGADSYIAKPFNIKILQARIENLLKARNSRHESFRAKMGVNISDLDYQRIDEQFVNNAIRCIEKHLNEVEFDIPQMAAELNVSRSTLGRKFRVITGLSALEFIRNVKLKHACVLLKQRTVNISEVAYATGFSSPKYFTKCFKDEFGITPKEYQSRENIEQ